MARTETRYDIEISFSILFFAQECVKYLKIKLFACTEVKSAGWNRYNSNELQVGGKCLIEISVNDLQQCDKNNNKNMRVNLPECSSSEINNKIEQQKLKQGPLWLHGYIQEMSTEKEPVLVFIKDLGEKKFVPYDALKPLPSIKKHRPRNFVSINRSLSVTPDSS